MHIQPHSNQLRKYIPLDTYFKHMEEQRNYSLIGLPLNLVDSSLLDKRLGELEALEVEGFVYVGEKNWLQAFREEQSADLRNYEQWVIQNFKSFLGLAFEISQDYRHLDYIIWEAEFDATDLVLGFEELQNPSYLEIDELEVLIGGTEQNLSPAHVTKAFEFLHNLEYTIAALPVEKIGSELSLTGIDVTNPTDPGRWELGVISTYGGDFEKTIINGIPWRISRYLNH